MIHLRLVSNEPTRDSSTIAAAGSLAHVRKIWKRMHTLSSVSSVKSTLDCYGMKVKHMDKKHAHTDMDEGWVSQGCLPKKEPT
eukprot:988932-Amphidinium_carterae.1